MTEHKNETENRVEVEGMSSADNHLQDDRSKAKHWLYRPENLPKLWAVQVAILVLALIPEFFVHHHAHFEDQGILLDATFGFFAWYGFLTCVAMVVVAKLLGFLLKRKDTYYDE